MKKTLLLTAALVGTLTSTQAQTFSNSGFETWNNFTVTTGFPVGSVALEAPTTWSGTDSLIAGLTLPASLLGIDIDPVTQIIKSTDAHSGTFAAEIKTANLGDSLGNVPAALINAKINFDILSVGTNPDFSSLLNLFTFTGGTPALGRKVDNVKAWVKAASTNMDQASITVNALQKAKTAANADTLVLIGSGIGLVSANPNNDYVETTVNVTYINAANTATDTLIVIFSSSAVAGSGTEFTDGNKMLVDDVSMTTSTGSSLSIRQPVFADDIALVYPNPAKNMIYFNLNTFQKAEDYTLTVTDASGRAILVENLKQQVNEKNVSGWAKGSYFYSLTNTKNGKHLNGKFSVE
ncbi:MAG: T9SS type A sorting domain-containing protein [Taibaiella sp.]|jgi:hypothetical protein